MPGDVVRFVECWFRNDTQNPSSHHGCVGFGRAERGSECCWLSQRGSKWMQTQFAQFAQFAQPVLLILESWM